MNTKFVELAKILTTAKLKIAVAESCTGGNLSAGLTSISGSSNYFDRGFVTYSNEAKIEMLGVDSKTLDEFGAVSEQVAEQMSNGVISNSNANISVSITGIAGPNGGSKEKPVGMVCFGFCINDKNFTITKYFSGARHQVVESSIDFVLNTIINELSA